ncbi:hypothetical protein [Lentisphaera araneosa]|nr:hypothetical protein [Lentisphaera araneosa]
MKLKQLLKKRISEREQKLKCQVKVGTIKCQVKVGTIQCRDKS